MYGLFVFIPGRALPQGSKKPVRNVATGKMSVIDNNPHLAEWRMQVTGYTKQAMGGATTTFPMEGPVKVYVTFLMARPKYHYGTGRNERKVKDSSPIYPTSYPDIDKLQRAILDGFTDAGVWLDDSQVVSIDAQKRYARWDDIPGASVQVLPL